MTKTAILFFSRKAEEEVKFKRLLPSHNVHENRLLIEKLISHNISILKESQIDFFKSSDFNIETGNFGETITKSISHVFSKGYESIIVIGNDTPGLSLEKILEAKKILNKGKTLIGPAQKGGIYLSAFHRSEFCEENFSKLPFQTNKMFEGITNYFKSKSVDLIVLEQINDLNSKADFLDYLRKVKKTNFLYRIYHFLIFKVSEFSFLSYLKVLCFIYDSKHRGPPILS